MLSIPFPQKASRTYELAGTLSSDLLYGLFKFDPAVIVPLLQVRKGILYRILSVSFSANCDETEFRQAFIPLANYTEPMARLVLSGNYTVTPKPFPVRSFFQSRETLNYFVPSSDATELGFNFTGSFQGSEIPGLAKLSVSYCFLMQELASEQWQKAFDEGKF